MPCVLGQPQDLVAIEQGYRRLGDSTDVVPQLLYTVTAVRRSWAQANQEAVVRYVRALAGAFKFIRDPANRDRVGHIVMQSTSSSAAIAQQTLALFFEPDTRRPAQARRDRSRGARAGDRDAWARRGVLKPPLPQPERFVDLQYLRAAGVQ